jgi:hypothetical protein
MRSLLNTTLSALLIFGFGPVAARAAMTSPLGVVTLADQARVGDSAAVKGSSVFGGEQLATGETGRLQVRFGSAQARLFPGSLAVVNKTHTGVNADLLSGTVTMATGTGEAFSLTANQAVIRSASGQAAIVQVTRVSPIELLLSSRRGALEVAYDGEVTQIAEGSSYRLLVEPPDPQMPQGAGAAHHSRKRLAFVLIGGVAAATGIAIAASQGSSVVSPSNP